MAVDVWSEISSAGLISPRLSFSRDLTQATEPEADAGHRPRSDLCLLDSDFNFFIGSRGEFSSADELFSNGRILPVEIKKQLQPQTATGKEAIPIPPPPAQQAVENDSSPQLDSEKKKLLKEFLSMSLDGEHEEQQRQNPPAAAAAGPRSFWQFKRSNSLNCDEISCRSRGGLIRSLHFLSRSNSTGSAPNPPKNKPKEENPRHLRKQRSVPNRKSPLMPTSSAPCYYPYNTGGRQQQKSNLPALRKCGSYGNNSAGIRITPVLNIPAPAFMSRGTVNFLGLGSLFCNGKVDKKKKKKR
ncbi:unnamed protein product [Linum tenue]|uniref:Uncharacterized protein n=1 Tax=Linum tenue TaxID=586396 RepID=A0AAV0R5Z9_9ROSI|nr:unnamed protein product [Linum tenue]